MNKISRKSFLRRGGVKTLYFMTLFTLAALAGVGLLIVPGFNNQASVSAQENAKQVAAGGEKATAEMLRIALDFRTATEYAVFAEKGISVKGKSQIKGSTGIARHDAETGARAQKDLSGAFNAISQLPATEISELSSGSFRAGVYSAPSAKLSGNLILDAESDPNAIFIFRVAGALRAENKLNITLVNGAEPHNVFFVAKGTATIGEEIEFRGNILAEDEVTIGRGSKVIGKALSLGGAVKLIEAAVSGGTGFLEICKEAEGPGLDGRIFAFRIGGIVREAPVGGCTGPIELPAGPVTVEELLTGSTISPLPIGTFEGRFRLISVTSSETGSLGTVNLPLRTAVVNIREASITNQTVLTFTNTFAVNAVVEICKRAADNSPDVTGFFNFTIDELSNTVITVPVGFCSGPIQVNVPTTPDSAVTNGLIDTLLKPGQETKNSEGYSTSSVNSPSDVTSSDVISRFVNVFYAALFTGNSTATADTPTVKATATAPSLVGVAPSLGTAGSFGVLAASTVTNTGSTIVTGNLGVSPGTAVTGFPPGTVVGGTIHAGDAVAAQAQSDATTAYNNLAGQACDINLTGTDLGGLTLTPGVYCFSSSAQLTGTLTLNAQGNPNAVFIFKIGSTLITASNSIVSVINGGTGCNVFFQVGSSATLGTGTRFTGNILALTSITLNTNANIVAGRALALNGAVTLDTNRVDRSQCTSSSPTPTPTPVTPTPTPTPTPVTPTPTPTPGTPTPTPGTPTPTPVTPTPTPTTPTPTPIPGTPTPTPGTPTPIVTIVIRELPNPGFTFTGASTFPDDRLINVDIPNLAVTTQVVEGGVSDQTTVNFFNRANPARLKVCKIAGPGIPEGTPFTFEVRGTVASTTTVIEPGTQVTRFITVPAGPPAQGGFCDFVRDTDGTLTGFVVGTPIAVNETGFNGVIPSVGPGQVRTANIRSSTGFTPVSTSVAGDGVENDDNDMTLCVPTGTVSLTATDGGNPDLEFGAGPCDTVSFRGSATIVPSRAATVEVEFTNFVFNPTLLKICKVAGTGVTQGTVFNFTVTVSNPATGGLNGPIFDPRLTTVSNVAVQAGPASSGGFCSFAQGPFTPTNTTPPVGTFNVGSTVTIAEVAAPGTVVTLPITSPTGTVTPVDPRSGSLVLGFRNGFNEITFVNSAAPVTPLNRAAFDFDGDGKSDPTIFRPATATWWYAASSANGQHRASQFGLAGDKLVAADYDGDGKTDFATYRKGIWHIMNSATGTYRAEQFGMTTETSRDIPQTGDFDGDGKADLAIYRPENGVWYMMNSRDGFSAVQFGLDGDKPVAADFDGDLKTDAAVYRNGTWHLLRSRDGYTALQFGLGGGVDTPVAADYDGDGKADAAVFRNDGVWHLLRSRDGYTSYAFGLSGDKAVPADYNGDGKTDLAVFRSGTWHLLSSGQGEAGQSYSSVNFGNGSDMAVPSR